MPWTTLNLDKVVLLGEASSRLQGGRVVDSLSIASLERAVAQGALDAWLARFPDLELRKKVQRALLIDRTSLARAPASLGSRLYARLLGEPAMASLLSDWASELDGRGLPWIKALRPIAAPPGLLLELRAGDFAATNSPQRIELPYEEILEVALERGSALELRWAGQPTATKADRDARGWRLVKPGWGPVSLVRGPEDRVELPCLPEGSASAFFSCAAWDRRVWP